MALGSLVGQRKRNLPILLTFPQRKPEGFLKKSKPKNMRLILFAAVILSLASCDPSYRDCKDYVNKTYPGNQIYAQPDEFQYFVLLNPNNKAMSLIVMKGGQRKAEVDKVYLLQRAEDTSYKIIYKTEK